MHLYPLGSALLLGIRTLPSARLHYSFFQYNLKQTAGLSALSSLLIGRQQPPFPFSFVDNVVHSFISHHGSNAYEIALYKSSGPSYDDVKVTASEQHHFLPPRGFVLS